jgi:hypothetical protein
LGYKEWYPFPKELKKKLLIYMGENLFHTLGLNRTSTKDQVNQKISTAASFSAEKSASNYVGALRVIYSVVVRLYIRKRPVKNINLLFSLWNNP